MKFMKNFKSCYSVLTNGITELEIYGSRHDCSIDPGNHIFAQDGYGNMYIDGIKAHIEIRERKD